VSVNSIIIRNEGNSGKLTGDAFTTKREYTVALMASCTSKLDTEVTVAEYLRTHLTLTGLGNLPYLGRTYKIGNTRDTSVYCENMDISRIGKSDGTAGATGGVNFLISAHFKPIEGGGLPPVQKMDLSGQMTGNPFLWRDEISTSDYTVTIPAETGRFLGAHDGQGNNVNAPTLPLNGITPIMNSALEVFDPPPEREVSVTVLRITKYVDAVFPHRYEAYKGAVNSDDVLVSKYRYNFTYRFPATTGKIKSINNVFDIANGIPYWKQTLEVHINPLGWNWHIPDRGKNQLGRAEVVLDGVTISNSDVGPSGYFKKRILDVRGNPVEGLLNGAGLLLKKGEPPVYLEYQLDNYIPFAGINW
jgi:hypothetical protein